MSFKVGDWVQHKYLNTIFQVEEMPHFAHYLATQVKPIDIREYTDNRSQKDIFKDGYLDCITSLKLEPRIKWDSCLFQGKYNSDDCVLWQPKEGEWCWFWNKDSEMPPVLRRFKQTQKDGAHITKDDCYFYDYCETFIGELPSFLKDK